MAKVITINVKDGEVTVPIIGKGFRKSFDGKTDKVDKLIRVFVDPYTKNHCIQYFYPTTCGGGNCSIDAWTVDELKDLKPCSVDFWNKTVSTATWECRQDNSLSPKGTNKYDEMAHLNF